MRIAMKIAKRASANNIRKGLWNFLIFKLKISLQMSVVCMHNAFLSIQNIVINYQKTKIFFDGKHFISDHWKRWLLYLNFFFSEYIFLQKCIFNENEFVVKKIQWKIFILMITIKKRKEKTILIYYQYSKYSFLI